MNLDRDAPYILTVPDVLSAEECARLIDRIEELGPRTAPVNTLAGPQVKLGMRNNERVMFDDAELADLLYQRIADRVPSVIHGMTAYGANERIRCYRYKQGMRFAPHADAAFHRNDNDQSWYTLIVYLNDGFEGGNTTFIVEPEVSIEPERGKALLFQHPLVHEGSEVLSGVKYVVRSDVMYRGDVEQSDQTSVI